MTDLMKVLHVALTCIKHLQVVVSFYDNKGLFTNESTAFAIVNRLEVIPSVCSPEIRK